jgi:SAM-dependent methyltransferase
MPTQSRYYEAHDAIYVERIRAGQLTWDEGEYDQFLMRPFLDRMLAAARQAGSKLSRPKAKALDLGCGTGPASCYLAEAGFDVTGIDIAPSAIALAREMAAKRNLDIKFLVADVCREPFPEGPFDLVVDGHLLHCIVFPAERSALLEKIRGSMTDDGEFWVETMLLEKEWTWDAERQERLDDGGVYWCRLQSGDGFVEAVERDDGWWLPQRYIARSHEALLDELRAAGFEIAEFECCPPDVVAPPGCLRVRCAREQGVNRRASHS